MENASILHEFANNVLHNLFKPLLLFFYMGFLIPILKVPFEFPKVAYQAITIFLLIAIGWHGGEELASLGTHEFMQAGGFMVIGFITNAVIGVLAYLFLRSMTKLMCGMWLSSMNFSRGVRDTTRSGDGSHTRTAVSHTASAAKASCWNSIEPGTSRNVH